MSAIRFTILGKPVSHKNGYRIVTIKGRPAIVKSAEALVFEKDTLRQVPPSARQRLEGPVRVVLRMFYASERPDLDESLVLDCLQDRWARMPSIGDPKKATGPRVLVQAGVYRNDKQVRSKAVDFCVDASNPRIEVVIEPLQPQQSGFLDVELLQTFRPTPRPEIVPGMVTGRGVVPSSLLFPDET